MASNASTGDIPLPAAFPCFLLLISHFPYFSMSFPNLTFTHCHKLALFPVMFFDCFPWYFSAHFCQHHILCHIPYHLLVYQPLLLLVSIHHRLLAYPVSWSFSKFRLRFGESFSLPHLQKYPVWWRISVDFPQPSLAVTTAKSFLSTVYLSLPNAFSTASDA